MALTHPPKSTPAHPPAPIRHTLVPTHLGTLSMDPARHPEGRAHLSAASGLVRSGQSLFVVADGALHFGVFADTPHADKPAQPGHLLHLLEGDVRLDFLLHSKAKPTLATLALLPPLSGCVGGALLALGSGARAPCDVGVLVALSGPGMCNGRMARVDLKPLYAPLRKRFSNLNVEAAWVSSGELVLLHSGSVGDARTACIRYDWNLVAPWLAGLQPLPPAAKSVQLLDLGTFAGAPLRVTDGSGLPDGAWMFSAVAQESHSSATARGCRGSVLGIAGADGRVRLMLGLQGAPRVEGMAVQREADDWVVTLVTDPGDLAMAAQWMQVRWPLAVGG